LRWHWTVLDADGYPIPDPAAEPKPKVGAQGVALYEPDDQGVDIALPARVINDHGGPGNDLLTLVTTERQIVRGCRQGSSNREWAWEPASLPKEPPHDHQTFASTSSITVASARVPLHGQAARWLLSSSRAAACFGTA
jgi:hypothetical protein